MTLPEPVPGLVIRYSYLWHFEHQQGNEEGLKDRPCAIIAAIRTDDDKNLRVLVLPITHTPPEQGKPAIEIPAPVKRRLGLDDERSWVVLTEWNDFVWPGPDLRRVSGAEDNSVAYGMFPPSLFAAIRDRFLALTKTHTAKPVHRTE